jgi:hypothetical protein
MATNTSLAGHRGEQHRRAVTFDPSLFGVIHVAARNVGIKQASCGQRNAGGAIADGYGIGWDAKPLTDFFAGHYPERF